MGTSFSPDHAEAHLAHIRKGAEAAGRALSDLELQVSCAVAIGDDLEAMIDARRPQVAFSMGAMGSAKTNFYNDAFKRAGYTDDALAIQKLWIDGKREEAAKRVPDAMVTQFGAFGNAEQVRQRFQIYRDAGINSLGLRLEPDPGQTRLGLLEQTLDLLKA